MRPRTILAALGTALAATLVAAAPAGAAATSATIDPNRATLNLDGADDNVTVTVDGGVLVHGQAGGGLNSGRDWNSAVPDDQTVPADGTFTVVVNGGAGNDSITVLAKTAEVVGVILNGEAGDDVLTGSDDADVLRGGEGNDRLVGAKADDFMFGDAGNDTMVWNQGDNSDQVTGGDGNDATEVNGAPTLGDSFTIDDNAGFDPNGTSVLFRRTNLGQFTIQAVTERFEVNGLGGNDRLDVATGVERRTTLSADGGAGSDLLNGSDGADLLSGGEGNDDLDGRGGDDRLVGDRGGDVMLGAAGDDTLVWNNGDGSDVVRGDDGRDDVEVNGHPALGDAFALKPDGALLEFERTNLVPFFIGIGSAETMHVNGLGGNDSVTLGSVGGFDVTAAGGAGNDTLTGGPSSETLLGGSGDDAITAGGALDVVSGDDGSDTVNVRDRSPDLARGGSGVDQAVADEAALDILDGFEAVDRTPVVAPPPVDDATRPVLISGRTVKVNRRRRTASIRARCLAASPVTCTGSLTLETAGRVRLSGIRSVVRLGRVRYRIAAGTTRTLRVKLPAGVRRVADRRGRIKARAIAATGASGKTASSSKRLTLALGAARR